MDSRVTSQYATHLLWRCAGQPKAEADAETAAGLCYWCGQEIEPPGRRVKSLPSTFFDAAGRQAGAPKSGYLCRACAWTLSDRIILPGGVARRKLDEALTGSGRVQVARAGVGERALVLRMADGQIGVWAKPGKRAAEKAWLEARETLRAEPRSVGAAELWGVWSHEEIVGRTCGKFRNYIAYGDASGAWKMLTKADRQEIRRLLTVPHQGPWCCAIGDGQKHAAIYTPVSDGREPLQGVYLEGAGEVYYQPGALAELVDAVEDLVLAGARDEEILSGQYRGKNTMGWLVALRRHEPTVRFYRGYRILRLALWLRRSVADLKQAAQAVEEE